MIEIVERSGKQAHDLTQLADSVPMADSSYGCDHEDTQDLNNHIARRPGFENWTGFGFWYRESPQEFRADTLGQDIPRYGNATVDLWYPGWSVVGMRGVRLDNAGLLRWIQAIPPMEKGVAIEEKSLLFKALATALNGSKKRTCLGSHAKLVMVQH